MRNNRASRFAEGPAAGSFVQFAKRFFRRLRYNPGQCLSRPALGCELFYRSGDKMMAVDIATQPSFSAGKPRVLFEGRYVPSPATFRNYDISSDGQRFLMLKPSEQEAAAPREINVVLNWSEELKRRVPPAKK